MKIQYNIAGLNIIINSEIRYRQSDAFSRFIDQKNDSDIEINILLKNRESNINKLEIFEDVSNSIYKQNNIFYREYHGNNSKNPLSCFIQKVQKNNKYYCYLYKNSVMNYTTYDIFSMVGLEYLLNLNKTIILHSSQILYQGKSILFTAPSGIGKSTQADLWEKYENAEIINGDRSAIRKIDGVWTSYGLPYAGSSKIYKNIASPIGAIVILRQGKVNEIKRASKIELFKLLYSETTVNIWDKEYIKRTSDIIENIVNEVPVYIYYCLPDKSAVDKLKGILEVDVYGTAKHNELFI